MQGMDSFGQLRPLNRLKRSEGRTESRSIGILIITDIFLITSFCSRALILHERIGMRFHRNNKRKPRDQSSVSHSLRHQTGGCQLTVAQLSTPDYYDPNKCSRNDN